MHNIMNIRDKYPKKTYCTHSIEMSIKAGEVVGQLYDAFLKQYKNPSSESSLKSLNKLCVRIVFCLYAEHAGIFGKRLMFHDYLEQFNTRYMHYALKLLFCVLAQKEEERDAYLPNDLAAFPYVGGGLFEGEDIEIPMFTDEIRELLLVKASEDFDWSGISPTIFGAVFESTLNPETRRASGMHYTSIENIHKVIDPLFLDGLKDELEGIAMLKTTKTQNKRLKEFQKKLASLVFLDPAAGSGNFLTETYLSLRRLENRALAIMTHGQMMMGFDGASPADLRKCPMVLERIAKCKEAREKSIAMGIRKFAATPTLFAQITQPESEDYILVPGHSSQGRTYVPIGFVSSENIVNDAVQIIPGANMYHLGILVSSVHMAWMRAICGRIKSDYRYGKDIVYNNFPWPSPTKKQKQRIELAAQGILDARAKYPDSSLADLYDDLTMPQELRTAHQTNDQAVMEAYGFPDKGFLESDCVAELMKMYQKLMAK